MERARLSINKGAIYKIKDGGGKSRPGICFNNNSFYGTQFQFSGITSRCVGRVLPLFIRDDNVVSYAKTDIIQYNMASDIHGYNSKEVSEDYMEMLMMLISYSIGLPISKTTYLKTIEYLNDFNNLVIKSSYVNSHGDKVNPIDIKGQIFNIPIIFTDNESHSDSDSTPNTVEEVNMSSYQNTTNIGTPLIVNGIPDKNIRIIGAGRPSRYNPYRTPSTVSKIEKKEFNINLLPVWYVDILKEHFPNIAESEAFNEFCFDVYNVISGNNRGVKDTAKKYSISRSMLYNMCYNIEYIYKSIHYSTPITTLFIESLGKNTGVDKNEILDDFNNWLNAKDEKESYMLKRKFIININCSDSKIGNILVRTFGSGNKHHIIKRIELVDSIINSKQVKKDNTAESKIKEDSSHIMPELGEINPKGYPAKKKKRV